MKFLDSFLSEQVDPRSTKYPILNEQSYIAQVFIIIYLFGIYIVPKLTKSLPALELKSFIYLYNILEVFLNSWIIYEFLQSGWNLKYFGCVPIDKTITLASERSARALHFLVWIKIFDFIETFIFILRKKFNQVSFLHVVHHVITVNLVWLIGRYSPGGSNLTFGIVNCCIHLLMYSYYLLSALGVRNLIFFKRFITIIQLVQFVFVGIGMFLLQLRPSCQYPAKNAIIFACVSSSILFFVLFVDFFIKIYIKPQKKLQ